MFIVQDSAWQVGGNRIVLQSICGRSVDEASESKASLAGSGQQWGCKREGEVVHKTDRRVNVQGSAAGMMMVRAKRQQRPIASIDTLHLRCRVLCVVLRCAVVRGPFGAEQRLSKLTEIQTICLTDMYLQQPAALWSKSRVQCRVPPCTLVVE